MFLFFIHFHVLFLCPFFPSPSLCSGSQPTIACAASSSLRSEYVRVGLYDVFEPLLRNSKERVERIRRHISKHGKPAPSKKYLDEFLSWVVSSTLFREWMDAPVLFPPHPFFLLATMAPASPPSHSPR